MENILESPYFLKIVLTILAVVIKLAIDAVTKGKEDAKGLIKLSTFFIFYLLLVTIIVWINLDNHIGYNKLTFNIGLIVFSYLQTRVTETNRILANLANVQFDEFKKLKQINEVQVKR
jgi:asparagine N-glycosylation enzyme membrane subunit Stt3